MKRILFQSSGAIIFALALFAQCSMQAQEALTPGPEHEILKKMEGTWTVKVNIADQKSEAVVTYKMECGGLWLTGFFQGELFGQKFEGRGIDGYNAQKKKYVSVWVDSMSAQPLMVEGDYNKEKKMLTMRGEAPGPDGQMATHKLVTHLPDDDHQSFSMYIVGADGTEVKVMSAEYTRKK